ncbi:MAG: hypothetical protein LBG04_03895, partial [Holosporaceae bacterium]|nr:hypothetical protein [Holosporaceae bacterium]
LRESQSGRIREIAEHFQCEKTTVVCAKIGNNIKRRLYREKDEEKRKKFTDFVKTCRKSRLIYIDESCIDEYLHREYARAKRGEKIIAEIPGKSLQDKVLWQPNAKKM